MDHLEKAVQDAKKKPLPLGVLTYLGERDATKEKRGSGKCVFGVGWGASRTTC